MDCRTGTSFRFYTATLKINEFFSAAQDKHRVAEALPRLIAIKKPCHPPAGPFSLNTFPIVMKILRETSIRGQRY